MRAPVVCRVAGITYRQLDHWTRAGYLRPTNPDSGSGNWRDYPVTEVRVAQRMGWLIRLGVHPSNACLAAREGGATLTVEGRQVAALVLYPRRLP